MTPTPQQRTHLNELHSGDTVLAKGKRTRFRSYTARPGTGEDTVYEIDTDAGTFHTTTPHVISRRTP